MSGPFQKQPIGDGPFFTYRSGNGKFGLSADSAFIPESVGLAMGAIYESRELAIAAALLRITRAAHGWRKRALAAEAGDGD